MRPFLLFIGEAFLMLLTGGVLARTWGVPISMDPELRFFTNVLPVEFAGLSVNSLYEPMHEDARMTRLWMYSGLAFALARMADHSHEQRDIALTAGTTTAHGGYRFAPARDEHVEW